MKKYPANVRTVDDVTASIKEIFGHPDLRVERFRVEVVTPNRGKMKLTWDRTKVLKK